MFLHCALYVFYEANSDDYYSLLLLLYKLNNSLKFYNNFSTIPRITTTVTICKIPY